MFPLNHYLKYFLFGTVLFSFFGRVFTDDYDPRPDVFDQLINTLVPTVIIALFDTKNPRESDEFNSRGRSTWLKCKQVFDDFLFLLSIYIFPCVVAFKNIEIPLWIPILFGVAAGFVFLLIIFVYWGIGNKVFITYALVLGHDFSSLCFLLYTEVLPQTKFTKVFYYINVAALSFFILLSLLLEADRLGKFESIYFNRFNKLFYPTLILVNFIWTPIFQMLNMALLSGNDYYWTKSILAVNLIFFSRILNYIRDKHEDERELFGMLGYAFFFFKLK